MDGSGLLRSCGFFVLFLGTNGVVSVDDIDYGV